MSKPKKRKLTAFLCQELLYDYAIDALDSDRKAAVEEFLKEDPETRMMLETIHRGSAYAEQLSNFEISDGLLKRLEDSENIVSLSKKVSSYNDYPDWVKWSLATILASACIAMIAIIVPWSKLIQRSQTDSKTVVLAPLSNEKDGSEEQTDEGDLEHESSGDFDESGAPVEDPIMPLPQATVAAVKPPLPVGTIPPLDKIPKVASAPAAVVVTSTPTTKPTTRPVALATAETEALPADTEADAAAASEVAANAEEDASQPVRKEDRARGYVFRGFMTISNIEDVSDQIVQQIKELGGAKAGEVELGWKRGTLRYFHFTLPSASEEQLLVLLRAYGPVRISKDTHPRIMPEGQVRFILSIDAK